MPAIIPKLINAKITSGLVRFNVAQYFTAVIPIITMNIPMITAARVNNMPPNLSQITIGYHDPLEGQELFKYSSLPRFFNTGVFIKYIITS